MNEGRESEAGRPLRSAERKLQVFVSSVTEPLREVRRPIGAEIESLGMHPWIFEETPPSGEKLEESYLRHIPDSEFFIWLVNARTSEPTQAEVRLAMSSHKPSLLVVEIEVDSRDAITEALLREVRGHVRTARATATRVACAGVVRAALLDELTRAKQWEVSQKQALHQLPAPLSTFVDREAEMARLRDLLTETGDDRASVLMSGMGGVGKSALALAVAHQVKPEFPEAQLYLDLRDPTQGPLDPGEIVATLLRTLGVPPTAIPPELNRVKALLTSVLSARRCLILLDNAHDAEQVAPVVSAAATGAIIVTSRDPLREVDVSVRLPLELFDRSDSVELLRRLVGERIDNEPEAASRVAELCGDLGLALRLAGSRLATRLSWRIADYAEALTDETERLEQLDYTQPGLRASFNLSYEELSATEASLFRSASIFETDFAADAASAVTGRDPTASGLHLENLVDAGLLLATGLRRYRFHDLLRLFARERRAADESPEERNQGLVQLARWYVEQMTEYRQAIRPQGND